MESSRKGNARVDGRKRASGGAGEQRGHVRAHERASATVGPDPSSSSARRLVGRAAWGARPSRLARVKRGSKDPDLQLKDLVGGLRRRRLLRG